jgi:hypothetical protein
MMKPFHRAENLAIAAVLSNDERRIGERQNHRKTMPQAIIDTLT